MAIGVPLAITRVSDVLAFGFENRQTAGLGFSLRGDAVCYLSVPAGALVVRHADSHGHRLQKHLDLRKDRFPSEGRLRLSR